MEVFNNQHETSESSDDTDTSSGSDDGLVSSNRRSMHGKRRTPDSALFAYNYLNQPLQHKGRGPNSPNNPLKPFLPKAEQSQYLRRNSHLQRLKRGPYVMEEHDITTPAPGPADDSMKAKIALIVDRTMNDAEVSISGIADIKAKYAHEPAFKIGFIIGVIKRASYVLDRLFNVAMKHKEQWQALEQLKLYELMMHTSFSITSLSREAFSLHADASYSASASAVRVPRET